MSEEKIAEALGLMPLSKMTSDEIEEKKSLVGEIMGSDNDDDQLPVPASNLKDENIADIEFAKNNIKEMIDMGDMSLRELIAIAKQSESPRAFEVVSTMMKTMMDANKEFVDMSTKKMYAQEDTGASGNQTNVTNNNLILSTTDLLKMMKGEA